MRGHGTGPIGRAVAVVVVLAASAFGCGDDGDDGGEVQLVADLDPCSLLTAEDAAELSGAEVTEVGGSLGGLVGCSYAFAGDATSDETGATLAAQLVLSPAEGDGDEALESSRDDAVEDAGEDAEVTDVALAGAPAGASIPTEDVAAVTITTTTTVQVIYVVEDVTVEVVVNSGDGAIADSKVAEVVTFTETTVQPVKEAVVESDIDTGDIEGLWTGDWGTMVLEEADGTVRATYTHDEGTIVGTFENGVVRGWWTEVPGRSPDDDAGEVEFRFAKTDDGVVLDGRWRYGTEGELSEDWDLTRSDEDPPDELLDRFDDDEAFIPHP